MTIYHLYDKSILLSKLWQEFSEKDGIVKCLG